MVVAEGDVEVVPLAAVDFCTDANLAKAINILSVTISSYLTNFLFSSLLWKLNQPLYCFFS